jgi:hypothetical protein
MTLAARKRLLFGALETDMRCRWLPDATRRALAAACVAIAFASAAFAAQPSSAQTWEDYANAFVEATFAARPYFAVWAGRHEFDGRMPDLSKRAIRREVARLRAARKQALAFDGARLSENERFERDYLVAFIDGELFWWDTAADPFRNPAFYSWPLEPEVYVARDYAPLAQRMRAYIAYAKAIPRAAAQIRANLRTPLPRSYVRLGHIGAGGLAAFYENDVPTVFANVSDPRLQAEFRAANAGAIKAMRALDAWYTQQEAHATEAYAMGPAQFTAMLRIAERIDVPLARLAEIAERDLARNLDALRDACRVLLPETTIAACVARVQADKPRDPLETATAQLDELRTFLQQNAIVTIPGSDTARVAESPTYERWNPAHIRVPGPFDRNVPSIYYIAPPDPNWTSDERDAYVAGRNDLLFISVHEVWPGHFVQFQHANRLRSIVGRVFGTYSFNEGWAHYAEELLWEAGLPNGDPAVHVGQLLNALVRNVRLLSAIGLHTGGMTIDQSAALFRDKAYLSAAAARQQADRGTFDPGYGSYTLGKLMIRKLRDDWTATRGGRQAWQAFHDRLLSYGAPPLPLVRKAMLGPDSGPPL